MPSPAAIAAVRAATFLADVSPSIASAGRSGSSSSSGYRHSGSPSRRHMIVTCQRGAGSPGYHLPSVWWATPSGAYRRRSLSARSAPFTRFSSPSADTRHIGSCVSVADTNVGSPPIVRRTSPASSAASTARPVASMRAQVTSSSSASPAPPAARVAPASRSTRLWKVIVCTHGSTVPTIGAERSGWGVADSGMWPSPAIIPEVASRPIQPAPGTNASAQAWRSVRSVPRIDSSSTSSPISCTR